MGDAPKEAKNTLRSKAVARIVDLIGEGQVEIIGGDQGVYLEKTQLERPNGKRNFTGVKTYFREGTRTQDYIPGFRAAESEINIGVQLKVSTGDVIRTITDLSADAFIAKIRLNGLSKTNPKNGDINKTRVAVSVWRKNSGGSYVKVHTFKYFDKTNGTFEDAKRIDLPAGTGPWDIKFVRETPDSDSQYIRNDTFVTSYTLVYDAKLAYTWSAVVGIEVDAKKFGSTFPARRYRGRRKNAPYPSNWNPTTRVYTGIWDGTFLYGTHDNPAWYIKDLIESNRYGLGDLFGTTGINKWQLYSIAQYCDGMINGKPRFTFNVQVMTRSKAIELLDSIASVFRGMIYWRAGAVDFAQDRPGSPVVDVTAANTIDGLFHRVGTARKARHSQVVVAWNNPAKQGDVDYVTVTRDDLVAKYGLRTKEIAAFGCTDEDEARRAAENILVTEETEQWVITWKAGLDQLNVLPGVRARIFDPAEQGARFAGRIRKVVDNAWSFANDMSNAVWFKSNCSISSNVINDWKGALLADKLVEGAVTAIHQFNRNAGVALVNGDKVIFSYMLKAAERTRVRVQLTDNTLYAMTYDVDLTTGAVLFNPVANAGWSDPVWSVVDYGGGWWWISLGGTKVGSDPDGIGSIQLMNGAANNYAGDGVSGFYIAHGQYEFTSAAGIPTEFAAVQIDDPDGVTPGTFDLNVMTPSATFDSKAITRYSDGNTYLHVGSRFAANPQLDSMWSITGPSVTGEIGYVTGVFEKGHQYEVHAVISNPNKYSLIERGVTIEHPIYSVIPSGQLAAPETLQITEFFVNVNNDYKPVVLVSWLNSPDARVIAYEYQWAVDVDGEFNDPVRDDTLSFELENIPEGILRVQVRSVCNPDVIAVPSDWQLLEVSVMGANAKPANITGARVNSDGSIATIKWDRATDALTNTYEVRFSPLTIGASWDGALVVATNISKRSAECATISRIGTFLIKGVSSNGKYSVTAAKVVCSTDASDSAYGGTVDESANWYGLNAMAIMPATLGQDFTGAWWSKTNLTAFSSTSVRETVANAKHQALWTGLIHRADRVNYTCQFASVGSRNVRVRIYDDNGGERIVNVDLATSTVISQSGSGFTGVVVNVSNVGTTLVTIQFDVSEDSTQIWVELTTLNGSSDTFAGSTSAGFSTLNQGMKITNKTVVNNAGALEFAASGSDYRTDAYYEFANSASYLYHDPSVELPKKSSIRARAKFEYTVNDDGGVIGDLGSIGDAGAIGGNADGITITPQIRSSDSASSVSMVYGEWQDLTDALFTGRSFQFRFLVTSTNPLITPVITSAVIDWEVPNYVESDTGLVSGGGFYTVTFDKEFLEPPSIQVTPYSNAASEVDTQTTTGFRVRFSNFSGTPVNRTFDWTATGYGPVIP